ncbi:hypothetical protein CUJ87_24610 [Paraburkholderia caledonica]|nr:hypothetical protein CUJ87_24610 [Paraburkholderia caledonica]
MRDRAVVHDDHADLRMRNDPCSTVRKVASRNYLQTAWINVVAAPYSMSNQREATVGFRHR